MLQARVGEALWGRAQTGDDALQSVRSVIVAGLGLATGGRAEKQSNRRQCRSVPALIVHEQSALAWGSASG